jgi:phage tail-like protein
VEFEHVEVGGFARVKGIGRETKVESYREGGVNDFEYKLVTNTTYNNLVLERGMVDPFLWEWHQRVISGKVERLTLSLVLKDADDATRWRWSVERAYPIKSSVTDFDAMSSQVLVESIELVHHGLRLGL